MKATFLFGAGDVRVLEVPDPVIEASTDAIIRVVRGCICGSDLHPFHAMPASEHGRHMGHEAIGVVEDIGADVTTLRAATSLSCHLALVTARASFAARAFPPRASTGHG